MLKDNIATGRTPKPSKSVYLKIAKKIFEERGFRGTTLKDIARKAGGATEHLASLFEGKEDLFEKSHAYCADRVSPLHEKVLDAARDLFLQSDYKDVSMEDIAERAGVSRSAAYRLFSGKKALWGLLPEVHSRETAIGLSDLQYSLIMTTAKTLFEQEGYNETTFEKIADRAMINKSSLVYHFKTKEALFDECGAERVDTKNRVIEATIELVAEHGFSRVTNEMIASAAGISPSLINKVFGTKADLLAEAATPVVDRLLQGLESCFIMSGLSARMRIMSFFEWFVNMARTSPSRAAFFAHLSSLHPLKPTSSSQVKIYLGPKFLGVIDRLSELLKEGVKDGSVVTPNPYHTSFMCMYVILAGVRGHAMAGVLDESVYDECLLEIEKHLAPPQD